MVNYDNEPHIIKSRLAKRRATFIIVMIMFATEFVSGASAIDTGNSVGSIEWGNCTNPSLNEANAECGFLSVLLDYAQPRGAKIQLAVSRSKHTVSESNFQGVMLVYPGGPGFSGLTLSTLSKKVPNMVGDAYDWIGFDPRGVGSSKPAVSCLSNQHASPRPNYTPSNEAVETFWLKRSKNYATACTKNNGKLLEHMTTIDMVKDIESIRLALGQSKINFYGIGYGTYVAQAYATLHPNRVRRMVFDSTLDPHAIWYEYNQGQELGFERNVHLWFQWLAKYDSVFHLGNVSCQVETQWNNALAQLEKNPINGTVGPSEWLDVFYPASAVESTWPLLGAILAKWVNEKNSTSLIGSFETINAPGSDNAYAAYLAVLCIERQGSQSRNAVITKNWRTFSKAPTFTWSNAWFNGPCEYWPQKASKPVQVDGTKIGNILLISETYDAVTPYEGSLVVRRIFPGARLVAVPGGTKDSNTLSGNKCVDNLIAAYLQSGEVPPRETGNGADIECAPQAEPLPTDL